MSSPMRRRYWGCESPRSRLMRLLLSLVGWYRRHVWDHLIRPCSRRLYVIFIHSRSVPSSGFGTVQMNSKVSASLICVVMVTFTRFLLLNIGILPTMIRLFPALSKAPSVTTGHGTLYSVQTPTY